MLFPNVDGVKHIVNVSDLDWGTEAGKGGEFYQATESDVENLKTTIQPCKVHIGKGVRIIINRAGKVVPSTIGQEEIEIQNTPSGHQTLRLGTRGLDNINQKADSKYAGDHQDKH